MQRKDVNVARRCEKCISTVANQFGQRRQVGHEYGLSCCHCLQRFQRGHQSGQGNVDAGINEDVTKPVVLRYVAEGDAADKTYAMHQA